MQITLTGPFTQGLTFFDMIFDIGENGGDLRVLDINPTSLTVRNTMTNATATFTGTGLNLLFAPDGEVIGATGTITGWTVSDSDGNEVASISGFSWSADSFVQAVNDLFETDDPSGFVSLFSLQDITIDATSAVGDMPLLDITGISSDITYRGSSSTDEVISGSGEDVIRGRGGNDSIDGGGGNDRVFGDAGRDMLRGDAGNDTLNGGGGNDRMFGNAGRDVMRGDAGNDTLNGGGGNDRMFGNAGRDVMRGGGNNDTIIGGGGNDRMFGDAGRDVLRGDAGNDTLNGGGGNDRIIGGRGDDIAIGGRGADTFVFDEGDDTLTIRDFTFRHNDRLELDDALWSGNLSAADVISTYGNVVDGDFVLDFGNGDVIVLEGVTNTSRLENFIDIV